jgi:hypothetical protein
MEFAERPDASFLAQSILSITERLPQYELMAAQGEPSPNSRMDCLRLFATIYEQARVLLGHRAITDFCQGVRWVKRYKLDSRGCS